ncbi:MAG: GatB/YqeY domain-containing protein [Chloroflexi bacterium]|uniref:GatB/YqeY domain-containing protein n=1 Tax=Candidatus Flexifilum breve TaxID=3140694 RepID=UPI00313564D0|nr:GatB/YqeY domain-containing protein [Chloroflexota bacterium]
MDDVKAKLSEALKAAMVAKDTARRDVIRLMQSAVKQIEVDERKTLTNEDVLTILQKEVKKRRESAEEARKANRVDIAEGEEAEIAIIEQFLPQQLSRAEIEVLVRDAIAQTGATSAKEMGKVMGVLMPKTKGVADGKLVNEVVRSLLSS